MNGMGGIMYRGSIVLVYCLRLYTIALNQVQSKERLAQQF